MLNQKAAKSKERFDLSRKLMILITMVISLLAFEIFNYDITEYALNNLLGEVTLLGFKVSAVFAVAFCSIDIVALLIGHTWGSVESWYLAFIGLLGAAMNSVMTWWAIKLTLINYNFGNEVLTQDQLLVTVPIFVAALIYLTRILFVGALAYSVAALTQREGLSEKESRDLALLEQEAF